MGCSPLLFSLFLMSPCGQGGSDDNSEVAVAAGDSPPPPTVESDNKASQKPAEVLSQFNIRPGMTVRDLFFDGGYHTEVPEVAGKSKMNNETDQAEAGLDKSIKTTTDQPGGVAD